MAWAPTSQPLERTKVKISVLFPHRGHWAAEFVEHTWFPLRWVGVDWCDKEFHLCRVPSLPVARNTLVKQFLDTDNEYCLWIDEDMIVEVPSVKRGDMEMGDPNLAMLMLYKALRESNESIVTGLYRAKQKHGFNYAIWKAARKPDGNWGFIHIQEWNPPEANFFAVDVSGLGFCLMHRRVFEDLRDAGYGTDEKPYFHWEHPNSMSEDFNMLMKARELGFKTWCLTDVKLTHMGLLAIDTGGGFRVPRV